MTRARWTIGNDLLRTEDPPERRAGPNGPAAVAIEMMLAGAVPPDPASEIVLYRETADG